MKYGQIVVGKITDINDDAYYAQYEGVTYSIDKETTEEKFTLGELAEGMIYENRAGKRVMQVDLPDIRPGYFGWGVVTNVRKDLGVFIDVGLLDKDVVLSLDDLPEERSDWPKKGDKVYVSYEVDDKNRFWALKADNETIQALMKKAPARLMNQQIEATVYQLKLVGALAISPEGYRVFIHENELTRKVRLGENLTLRVINVGTDGSLNASLRPRAHEVIGDDAAMLIAILEKSPKGFLALHDKSDPQLIQNQIGISKAQFKRAVGQLLKQGKIRQEKNEGLYLL